MLGAYDRVVHLDAVDVLDVLDPLVVGVDGVDAHRDDLGVALVELRLQARHRPELGRADRGEVLGMGEQDAPPVTEILVEVELAFGGLNREVGGLVAELDGHVGSLRDSYVVVSGLHVTPPAVESRCAESTFPTTGYGRCCSRSMTG